MSVLFATEHGKFNLDSKNGKKMQQNIYAFSDNLISIGNFKFCLLLRKCSELAVNVLSKRPKILDQIKSNFFSLNLVQNDQKNKIKVLFCRFQEFLRLVNTFTAKWFSERSFAKHLNKQFFRTE